MDHIEEQAGQAKGKGPADQSFPENHFDIWAEIYARHSKPGASKPDVWMGYLDAHYFVTPIF